MFRDWISKLTGSPFFKPPGLYATIGLFIVFSASLAIDQVSKLQAQRQLLVWEEPSDTDVFQGGKKEIFYFGNLNDDYLRLNFQYSRNKGAAFSMLADLHDTYRVPIFYGITFIAVILIMIYLQSTPVTHRFTRLGLVFVFSGAIGNFIDRIVRGYVVDFIDVDWRILGWRHDFAIFNGADVCINIGLICLILDMIIHRKDPTKELPIQETK